MLATHDNAEKRYELLRKEALQAATEIINGSDANIRLSTIDSAALIQSKTWDTSKIRQVDWDWFEGFGSFKYRYPKRFELAVWNVNMLIGLSIGRPTYHGSALRLDFVEASPVDLGERPAIIEYVLLGYDIYARLINAKQVRIMHPTNKDVLAYYEKFGYEYVSRGDYLFRSIF